MKLKVIALLLFIAVGPIAYSQSRVQVHPKNSYIKENLDLNAVSLLYEESFDLADFEHRLNYPQERISNLDLNNDNKVDYLRVSEKTFNNIKTILIQSEIDSNIYEDVATINIVLKTKSTYTTESGIRPKYIIIPFVFTVLDVFLSRHR